MLKHILIIVFLSLLAVFFYKQVGVALHFVDYVRNYITHGLSVIFAGDTWGRYVRDVVVLAGVPIVVGLVVNAVYWLVEKRTMSIVVPLIWIIWVVFLASMH